MTRDRCRDGKRTEREREREREREESQRALSLSLSSSYLALLFISYFRGIVYTERKDATNARGASRIIFALHARRVFILHVESLISF